MSKQTATPTHAVGQIVPIQQSIINEETVYTVNARDLHKALNVRDDFSTWMKRRINECGFVENEDYLLLDFAEQQSTGTKHKKEYMIALDMAKHFAMLEKNPTGHQVRQGFIDYEKQTRNLIANPVQSLPTNPMDLLFLAVDSIKQLNDRTLQIESQITQVEDMALSAATKLDDFLDTRPLLPHQCHAIQKAVAEKAAAFSEKHGIYVRLLFSSIYGFLKRHFNCNTYSAIPCARFDEALAVTKNLSIHQLPDNIFAKARGGVK